MNLHGCQGSGLEIGSHFMFSVTGRLLSFKAKIKQQCGVAAQKSKTAHITQTHNLAARRFLLEHCLSEAQFRKGNKELEPIWKNLAGEWGCYLPSSIFHH